MATLVCTVRGCGRPLARDGHAVACAARHSFDVARSGYVNLLQPSERRSRRPGDAPAATAARRRVLDRGHAAALVEALAAVLAEAAPPGRLALLDVGCGEGFFLRALGARVDLDPHGVDLSTAAAAAAARLTPGATVVVANADRVLPFAAASFDAVTSITARLAPAEMRRVLRPSGLLVVVVPAADDLIELRAAALGHGAVRDRRARVRSELAADFVEAGARTVRHVVTVGAEDIRDLLAASYRAARRSEQARLAAIGRLAVTLAWDVVWLRPRATGG